MSRAHRRPLTAGNQLPRSNSQKSPMVPDKQLQASPQQAMGPNRIDNIESSPNYRAQVKENMEFALYKSLTQDQKSPTKFLLTSPSKSSPSPGKKIALLNALSLKYSGQDRQMIEKFVENYQQVPSPSANNVKQSVEDHAEVPGPSIARDLKKSVEKSDSAEVSATSIVNDDNLIHWDSGDLSLEEVLITKTATTLMPDYVAFIQDKFEQDILDESFGIECMDVDWHNHMLLKNDKEEEVFETESTSSDLKAKILEYTRGFFETEAEAMRGEEEEYDHLCPKVEVAVDGGVLNYGDKDCVIANRRFGNFAYVKLDKYYDCKHCKNKCFMDESLNNHLKYCRQYVHRNYNKLKASHSEKQRCKAKIFRQKDPKLNGEAKVRLEQFYYCPQSRQRYAMKSRNLRNHLKKCTLCRTPPNRECISCKKQFSSLFRLQEHINVVHGGMQRYRCDLCSESRLRSVSQKEEHIAFYHLGIVPSYKRFRCTVGKTCQQKFFSLADRKQHEKECATLSQSKPANSSQKQPESPTSNLPYRCSLCKTVFHARMQFLKHAFQDHPEAGGKVGVECPQCNNTFENMWLHNQHVGKCKPSIKTNSDCPSKNEAFGGLPDLSVGDDLTGPVHSRESAIPIDVDEMTGGTVEPIVKKLGRPRKSVTWEADKKPRGKRWNSLVLGHIRVGDTPRGRPRKDSQLRYNPVAEKRPQGRPRKSVPGNSPTVSHRSRSPTDGVSPGAVQKSPEKVFESKAQRSPSRVTSPLRKVFSYNSSTGTRSRPPPPPEVVTITLD